MPVVMPDFSVGPVTLRDARNVSVFDRAMAGHHIIADLYGFYPLEVLCNIPPWRRYLKRAAAERGLEAELEQRKGALLSVDGLLADSEPIVLVAYNAQGAVAGAFVLFGITLLGTVDGVRQIRVRPLPASTAVTVASKANLAFDVAEAILALPPIVGPGGNQFKVVEFATWFYRDAGRNSIGDQFMAAYQSQLITRTTRTTRPLTVTQTANDGLAGRRLDVIRAS